MDGIPELKGSPPKYIYVFLKEPPAPAAYEPAIRSKFDTLILLLGGIPGTLSTSTPMA